TVPNALDGRALDVEEAKAGRVQLGLLARQPDKRAEEGVSSLKLQAVGAVGVRPRCACRKGDAADGAERKIQRRYDRRSLPPQNARLVAAAQFACKVVAVGEVQRR